jgi:hypothetical protein
MHSAHFRTRACDRQQAAHRTCAREASTRHSSCSLVPNVVPNVVRNVVPNAVPNVVPNAVPNAGLTRACCITAMAFTHGMRATLWLWHSRVACVPTPARACLQGVSTRLQSGLTHPAAQRQAKRVARAFSELVAELRTGTSSGGGGDGGGDDGGDGGFGGAMMPIEDPGVRVGMRAAAWSLAWCSGMVAGCRGGHMRGRAHAVAMHAAPAAQAANTYGARAHTCCSCMLHMQVLYAEEDLALLPEERWWSEESGGRAARAWPEAARGAPATHIAANQADLAPDGPRRQVEAGAAAPGRGRPARQQQVCAASGGTGQAGAARAVRAFHH